MFAVELTLVSRGEAYHRSIYVNG